MKKILFIALLFTWLNAYTIGGAYAALLSCEWTQVGYQYGYVGTYDVNGDYYQVYFGDDFCEY